MRVIAALQADLELTTIGTRSRLAAEIGGKTILRRTVERIEHVPGIDALYVLCPADQLERCRTLLTGTAVEVRSFHARAAPWHALVRTARKWSLDGWRGGLGETTTFDEYTDCPLLSGLLATDPADAVLSAPAAAPLFDPELADRMIRHRRNAEEPIRLVFAQTPPGLSGLLMDAELVHELAQKNHPISWTFRYQPDHPQKDLAFQPCCFEAPRELRHAAGRMIADTDRAMNAIAEMLRRQETPDAAGVGAWLSERAENHVELLPREVEIELTTGDPYPDTLMRPRGSHVGRRGPIEVSLVAKVADEISRFDDALLVFGGFGDPLRHPRFPEIVERLGANRGPGSGVYGLAVRTAAVDLNDEYIDLMITRGVDVVEVTLDAWTPELYTRLHGPDKTTAAVLPNVRARLERLAQLRQDRGSVRPIVVPHFTKSRDNLHEMDAFYDGWLRRVGAVVIGGYSHFAGQMPDRCVVNMSPPRRQACRRIDSRCVVLADGTVTACDQDFCGRYPVGNLKSSSLGEIWQGDRLKQLRGAHRVGRFDWTPLCAACGEWHRP